MVVIIILRVIFLEDIVWGIIAPQPFLIANQDHFLITIIYFSQHCDRAYTCEHVNWVHTEPVDIRVYFIGKAARWSLFRRI